MLTGLLEDARFGSFSNLHTYISLVEVYRFGQCSVRDSRPFISFFTRVFLRVPEAPQSRFRCRYLKLFLLDFLKMLGLALSQIYARVFLLWKSIILDGVWVGDSCPFISFLTRLFSRVYICATLAFSLSASQTILTRLSEDARFNPFSNLRTCISLVEVYRFGQCLGWSSRPY